MFDLQKISNITFERAVRLCSGCGGDGEVADDSWGSGVSDMLTCDLCNGTGRTKIVECSAIVEVPFNYKVEK